MKTKILLLLCIILTVTACTPIKSTEQSGHEQVTVNLPDDDSVNGYRLPEESTVSPSVPSGSETASAPSSSQTAASSNAGSANADSSPQENKAETYIGNKNTHVLHRADCGSVKTMKEENKAEFTDRETPLSEGYTPCKRCKP